MRTRASLVLPECAFAAGVLAQHLGTVGSWGEAGEGIQPLVVLAGCRASTVQRGRLGSVLVSSIYTVEICPKSAEGGEKILCLGAAQTVLAGFGAKMGEA